MRKLLCAVAVLFLAGCASQQEIAAHDANHCASLGFQPGTDAYANCRLSLENERRRADMAAFNALQQNQPVTCYSSYGMTSCY